METKEVKATAIRTRAKQAAHTVAKLLQHPINRRTVRRHPTALHHPINKVRLHIMPLPINMGHHNTHLRPVNIVRHRILHLLVSQEVIRILLTTALPLANNPQTHPMVAPLPRVSIQTTGIVQPLKDMVMPNNHNTRRHRRTNPRIAVISSIRRRLLRIATLHTICRHPPRQVPTHMRDSLPTPMLGHQFP